MHLNFFSRNSISYSETYNSNIILVRGKRQKKTQIKKFFFQNVDCEENVERPTSFRIILVFRLTKILYYVTSKVSEYIDSQKMSPTVINLHFSGGISYDVFFVRLKATFLPLRVIFRMD